MTSFYLNMGHPAVNSVEKWVVKNCQQVLLNRLFHRYGSRVYDETSYSLHSCVSGPGSSVGIATDYGLDRPRSNPVGDEIFRPSRPALGPTQPPVKCVQGLSRG